mgnify:CR=1 FL=1
MKFITFLILFFIGFCALAHGQNSNYRTKKVAVNDSIIIDSVSINSSYFFIKRKDYTPIDSSFYTIDFPKAIIVFKKPVETDSIIINYLRFPEFLTKTYKQLDEKIIVENTNFNSFEISKLYLDVAMNRLWVGSLSSGLLYYDFNQSILKNISIKRNIHNTINVDAGQGNIKVRFLDATKPYQIDFRVMQSGKPQTLNVQKVNSTEKYLIGTYDIEILTTPRIYVTTNVEQSNTTNINIKAPGFLKTASFMESMTGIRMNSVSLGRL